MNKKIQTYFLIVPNLYMIGAQRVSLITAKEILKKGDKVFLIKLDNLNNLGEKLPYGIKIINIYAKKFWQKSIIKYICQAFFLARLFTKHSPEYSISIAPGANLVNLLAYLFSEKKVKVICEEHQHLTQAMKLGKKTEWTLHWRVIHFFLIKLYKYTYKLRVVSKLSGDDFAENWGIPKEKIILVNPLIDNLRIDKNIKLKENLLVKRERKNITFCSLGRLNEQKDFKLMIISFSKYLKKRDGQLLIAGMGEQIGSLQSLIDNLGIQKKCKLVGFVENSDLFIKNSDVFLLTSHWEGFPATLIESLYIGTPVISVDCKSGPKELLEDKYGVLVSRSSTEICNAMIKMNDNILFRKSFIEKGKKRALDFLPNDNWKKYYSLINN